MDTPPHDRARPAPTHSPPSSIPATSASFRVVAPETYEATLAASEPDTPAERVKRVVLGSPIPERLAGQERLDRVRALATLSSDALSSVAYGTEASLAVLVSAGAAALTSNLGIGLVTAALMLIVAYSYRQTIHAYPSGGGSYIVARENLGTIPGLVAAAALLLDYLLTVSVSVAAGIDAIASAVPALTPLRLSIELGAIVLIVLINLRGLRSAGTIFAAPTYLFLVSFGVMLVVGIARALSQGGLTAAIPPHLPAGTFPGLVPLTTLLILTAFASGCSAMTGVEAISNGVPAFNGPSPQVQAQRAAQTLLVMIALLVTFFVGTTYLAWRIGAVSFPSGEPTVTSQIARFAYSGTFGWMVYVVQAATLLILVFAANTSFADFPRLASILARDSFLPAFFAHRGERTAFSVGITLLGVLGGLVLWVFRGNVTSLINLYALGVFTAFTLSQTGMVRHWLRRKDTEHGWWRHAVANGAGALATAVVTGVIAVAKFDRGAWVIVVLVPLLVAGFLMIRAYYARGRILRLPAAVPTTADVVIMPILSHEDPQAHAAPARARARDVAQQQAWQRAVQQELAYAARVAPALIVVRVVGDQQEAETYRAKWERVVAEQAPGRFVTVQVEALISPYRTIVQPLATFVTWQARTDLAGKAVAVLLPREMGTRWWEWPLQRRVGLQVRLHLEQQQAPVTLIDVPFILAPNRSTA